MTPIEKAVVSMLEAKDAVDALSKQIGDAINESFESQFKGIHGPVPKDWLRLAYERSEEICDYRREQFYTNHDDDIEGFLSENCQHALRAHLLIQERKEARKQLGIARRRVSFMGRNLMKGMVQE